MRATEVAKTLLAMAEHGGDDPEVHVFCPVDECFKPVDVIIMVGDGPIELMSKEPS